MLYLLCQTLSASPLPSSTLPTVCCLLFFLKYVYKYILWADCRLPTWLLSLTCPDLPRPAHRLWPLHPPLFMQRAFEMLKVISSTIVDSRAASAASWQALPLAGCCCCALNYATHFASSLRACPSCVKVMECHKAVPCQEVA